MSAEWNEEQEEFARNKAYKLHKELFKIKGCDVEKYRDPPSKILDIHIVVSDTQAKVYIKELVDQSPSVLSLGRPCTDLGYCYSWPSGEPPRS